MCRPMYLGGGWGELKSFGRGEVKFSRKWNELDLNFSQHTQISSLYVCMAIKYIIVLFVETPRKFTWCFHKQNYYIPKYLTRATSPAFAPPPLPDFSLGSVTPPPSRHGPVARLHIILGILSLRSLVVAQRVRCLSVIDSRVAVYEYWT
jgi:hypothetical protein